MKLSKKLLSTVIAFALILLVFVVLVTVIPFEKNGASWVAFAFGVISIIATCAILIYSFGKGKNVTCKIYGFAPLKLAKIYITVQMIASALFLILGAFVPVPAWIAVVVCIIIVAFAGIGLIVVDNTVDIITEIDEKAEAQIKEIKTFTVNIGSIKAICKNSDVIPHLERLEEAFRYSDPVSSDATAPLEENLKAEIATLTTLVATNSENAVSKIQEIEALLSSRNAVCKLSK